MINRKQLPPTTPVEEEPCIDSSIITNPGCTKEYASVYSYNHKTYRNKCMSKNAELFTLLKLMTERNALQKNDNSKNNILDH